MSDNDVKEPPLTDLREAFTKRAADAVHYFGEDSYAMGFIDGVEHARLLVQLVSGQGRDDTAGILPELEYEERELRRLLERKRT